MEEQLALLDRVDDFKEQPVPVEVREVNLGKQTTPLQGEHLVSYLLLWEMRPILLHVLYMPHVGRSFHEGCIVFFGQSVRSYCKGCILLVLYASAGPILKGICFVG